MLDCQPRDKAVNAPNTMRYDFAKIAIRPKLRVSQPRNVYEEEADRIARHVMRMSEPRIQSTGSYGRSTSASLTEQLNEGEHLQAQRIQATDGGQSLPPIVQEVLASTGRPLDLAVRAFMESRFGRKFGQIRIHTDSSAARSAELLNADAYTFGAHIAFAQTRFLPGTEHGNLLLAHELVHTIQQTQLPRLRSNESGSTINPNIWDAAHLDRSIHIGTTTSHIALQPKGSRQVLGPSKLVGARLGSNQSNQDIVVKRVLGTTQGYEDRLQAIAAARLSKAEHAVVVYTSITGLRRWYALETTVDVDFETEISSGQMDRLQIEYDIWNLQKLPSFSSLGKPNLTKEQLASSVFGVPESEVQFNEKISQRQPGKINISAERSKLYPHGAEGEGGHGPVGGKGLEGFEKGQGTAFDISLELLKEPERASATLFHEVSHLKDFELAQMWVKKYEEGGGIFTKGLLDPFEKWIKDQAKAKPPRLSEADAELVVYITRDYNSMTEARANVYTFLAALQAGAPDVATDRLATYASALPGGKLHKKEGKGYAAPPPGSKVVASLTKELQTAYRQMSKDMQRQFDAVVAAAKKENKGAWVSDLHFSK